MGGGGSKLDLCFCLLHSQVVEEWFKKKYNVDRFGEPCWQMVVEAVRHPAGGDNPSLAEHIAKQYPRRKTESGKLKAFGECITLSS